MEIEGVVLGWLLGVLSTPVVMYLTAIVDRRRFEDTLKEELRELRFRLAGQVYLLRMHLGTLDRNSLQWVANEFKAYPAGAERDEPLKLVEQLLACTDDELDAYILASQTPRKTKNIPHIGIPYLSSRLDVLGLLCAKKQKNLVNLLHYIELINVKSEEVTHWNKATFELTGANYQGAIENITSGMKAIINSSERAVLCASNYMHNK